MTNNQGNESTTGATTQSSLYNPSEEMWRQITLGVWRSGLVSVAEAVRLRFTHLGKPDMEGVAHNKQAFRYELRAIEGVKA